MNFPDYLQTLHKNLRENSICFSVVLIKTCPVYNLGVYSIHVKPDLLPASRLNDVK